MTDYTKASKLMSVLQRQLEVHSDPDQYLVNICNVLINQQQQTLTDIAISILQQLGQFVILLLIIINIFHISGQPIPDQPTHSSTPDRPTHSSTPDRPTYSSTPDRPTYSSTSASHIERLNFFQRLFKKIRSRSTSNPSLRTVDPNDQSSSTPDRPTHSSTPDRPTHSSTPDRPTHSSTPDRPTHSSTPDRPTHSSTPDRPTHNSTPDRPTHSSTPDRPTHSSTPDRPTHSSTPDRPTHSSTPDRPTHSSTPDRPTHSSTPDRPTHSSTPDRPTHSSTSDPVQQYCQIIREKYTHQPVVTTDWPPPVGKNFFGQLMLLEPQQQNDDEMTIQRTWCTVRGQIDKIPKLTKDKQIDIEDVLEPNESGQSLTVVLDGPPGIGKTTLCHKLLNLWANGELKHKQYDLVLYCPLRNIKIAQATSLHDLFAIYQSPKVPKVVDWMRDKEGEGLLIIFDGWDELSTERRQSSLPTEIICKQLLHKCSVIVTSRSYASSSLLEIPSVNKHVAIMGFLKKEIKTVIKGTLENNPQIAQKLIDELKIRNDVQSLCYVPLICSIVILVYRKLGNLPTTLTQLYENFILQTIRRHIKIKGTHQIEPRRLYSIDQLPPILATSFKEMCQFAYLSLKENNPKMSFTSQELQQCLKESVKEGYLGLMTTFTVSDEEGYQFLHLSIQEFLAAWWIAKYNEKTEEIFNAHFDDDHFRMCLRFVAGLTQLKHEKNYQQYFNKELDLQCKWKPLFGFDVCYRSRFYQNPEIRLEIFDHVFTDDDDNNKFIALLQFLYESQNETLCEILSQSINNHSLCLYRVRLSVFDILCLSYFLNNSNITWNHLHLERLSKKRVQILTDTLTNNSQHNQCKILQVYYLYKVSIEQVIKLFQLSFFHNIQQCYIILFGYQQDLLYKLLLSLLQLHQLKILHLHLIGADQSSSITGQYSELTKCLEMNCTLQELVIERGLRGDLSIDMANDIVNGVANNKSITSFTLTSTLTSTTLYSTELSDETIQHLLKNNHTLQALDIYSELSSSLNIVEVNTPLTAMGLNILHLPHIKGLQYLKLYHQCHQSHLIFHSYPNLQQLDISLYTAESVNELFTNLQSNTTLKALRVEIVNRDIYSSIGNSLRDMLTLNKTIQCLEIDLLYIKYFTHISSTYLSYLTTGLSYNNSLQELSVHIPLSHTNNQQLQTYFNVISQKYNLTELKVYFTLDQSYSNCSDEEEEQILTSLYYEQGLPLVTNMLKLHTTIRLLHVQCYDINRYLSQSQWIDSIKNLLQTIFLHPSLEYIRIERTQLLQDTFKVQKKTLIDKRKQQQLIKPLPIVHIL